LLLLLVLLGRGAHGFKGIAVKIVNVMVLGDPEMNVECIELYVEVAHTRL
jgi:hypothetical protein